MEVRSGPRVVTQRQLEIVPPPAEPPANTEAPTPPPRIAEGPQAPPGPSNQGLLERQARWMRERARFESSRPDDEGSK